ncbi:MAG TPA: rhomboid family intramembrane serine protease, partial [Longimicrobium sp.]|nr:rhomboid family intramembrane serine protease [Longimicrobium sp.]
MRILEAAAIALPPEAHAPPRAGDDPRALWTARRIAGEFPRHGSVDGGVPAKSTREKLVRRCRVGDAPELVWTPEHPALTEPWEVPYLAEAIRKCAAEPGWVRILLACFYAVDYLPALFAGGFALGSPAAFFLVFCGVLVWTGARIIREARAKEPRALVEERRAALAEQRADGRRYERYTTVILFSILAVGLAQLAAPGTSIEAAGLAKEVVRQGREPWRLLTAALLHASVPHIAFNLMALLALGPVVEKHAHRAWLAIVFVAAALAGNLASALLLPRGVSVGASGGLLGIFGFLAVMGWRERASLPRAFSRELGWSLAITG